MKTNRNWTTSPGPCVGLRIKGGDWAGRGGQSLVSGRARQRGLMLIDCMVYIVVWFLVVGLAFAAFYRSLSYSRNLAHGAGDIASALEAGERWRADVRRATGPLSIDAGETGVAQALRIPQAQGEVVYLFIDGAVLRRARDDAPWLKLLPAVKSSHMQAELRQQVRSWSWSVELAARQKRPVITPRYSFRAVAPREVAQ